MAGKKLGCLETETFAPFCFAARRGCPLGRQAPTAPGLRSAANDLGLGAKVVGCQIGEIKAGVPPKKKELGLFPYQSEFRGFAFPMCV